MSEKDYSGKEGLKKIAELVKGIKFTMLTTVLEDGTLHARPMATQDLDEDTFDGDIYFVTRGDSPKAEEIREDQNVLLSYSDADDGKFISVQGVASLSKDKALIHKYWNASYKAWFPEGENDPAITVIKVRVTGAQYWEANSSRIVRLGQIAIAAITGGKTDVGDTGKIAV